MGLLRPAGRSRPRTRERAWRTHLSLRSRRSDGHALSLSALAIVLAGIAVLVFGVNALLTHLSGLDRSQRVGIATVGFFAGLFGLAWLLRRLQQRHVI